jgi:hypothetical protein
MVSGSEAAGSKVPELRVGSKLFQSFGASPGSRVYGGQQFNKQAVSNGSLLQNQFARRQPSTLTLQLPECE